MNTPTVQPFFHPPTGTWSYVVHAQGDAVIIDPVLDYDPKSGRVHDSAARELLAYVERHRLRVRHILETHAHADHLTAAALLRARTGAPMAIGDGIRAVQAHFARVFGLDVDDAALHDAFDATVRDGDTLIAGALTIEVLALPGHTPDGLGYRLDEEVFVGDTVFAPDIGTARCDFPGGSAERLYASIQRLYALPERTRLWLCHDYPVGGRAPRACVTAGESRRENRMLRADTPRDVFVAARRARDARLDAPNLMWPSLEVNIRGGRLPPPDAEGRRYLRTPLQMQAPLDGL